MYVRLNRLLAFGLVTAGVVSITEVAPIRTHLIKLLKLSLSILSLFTHKIKLQGLSL
ncbi:hypothetical protein C5167_019951 [Papaver somniferum]|uniref:Uncharacterized protein n=1 Tax=Papaver somniferum TaxID=3469 RepID=A0A4Y7IVK0_PAPSO|nr:hypothetical protein C5167_019951 [Papaver somniferum]